jgi:hypothetical protein
VVRRKNEKERVKVSVWTYKEERTKCVLPQATRQSLNRIQICRLEPTHVESIKNQQLHLCNCEGCGTRSATNSKDSEERMKRRFLVHVLECEQQSKGAMLASILDKSDPP